MSTKFVVGFDGSPASDKAIEFAINQAKLCSASLVLVHVLEWSPYSFLTPTEIEERHRRRAEELKRAKEVVMDPLIAKIKPTYGDVEGILKYGNIVDVLMAVSSEIGAAQIFIGRTGGGGFAERVFGSTAGTLAAHSPVPVTIVP